MLRIWIKINKKIFLLLGRESTTVFGLWKVCFLESNTCETMEKLTEYSRSNTHQNVFQDKLKVVRAFIIMGIISSVSSLVVTFFNVVGKIEMFKDIRMLSVLQSVTFCNGFIALSVYTAYFAENNYEQYIIYIGNRLNAQFSLGWPYFVGCIGTALAAVTASVSCTL